MNENAAITIHQVTKRFRNAVALDRVHFDISHGQIFGLLGPNGAGKTTLLRILVGILGPDEGQVQFCGDGAQRIKERIGYLPEDRGMYPKMKLKHLLRYFAALKGVKSHLIPQRIEEGIERVGLTEHQNKKVEELSKGNQQRAQLLMTLIHQPDFLILDEPFTGLDPLGVEQMKQVLIEETGRGATVIISTHRMEDAEQLCRHIVLINQGRVIRCGPLDQIKREEGQDELAVEFEGDPQVVHEIPGVSLIDFDGYTLRVGIEKGTPIPDIVRHLSQRISVYGVHRIVPTLHDIFVRLVKEEVSPS